MGVGTHGDALFGGLVVGMGGVVPAGDGTLGGGGMKAGGTRLILNPARHCSGIDIGTLLLALCPAALPEPALPDIDALAPNVGPLFREIFASVLLSASSSSSLSQATFFSPFAHPSTTPPVLLVCASTLCWRSSSWIAPLDLLDEAALSISFANFLSTCTVYIIATTGLMCVDKVGIQYVIKTSRWCPILCIDLVMLKTVCFKVS